MNLRRLRSVFRFAAFSRRTSVTPSDSTHTFPSRDRQGAIGRLFPHLVRVTVLAAFGLALASAQTQDSSGDRLLNGSFRFRHVAVQFVDENNDPTDITAVYGTITFDGAGHYALAGTSIDNGVANGAPQALNLNGTYAIGSNGLGYLINPLYPTDVNALIYGAVAQGVFTGSSTESEGDQNILNDIFIAIPVGAPPTNAAFTSSYQTGVLDFTSPGSTAIKNALFELNPDGKGNFGAITLNGQAGNQSNPNLTQSVTGATYNFNADGSATLNIPLPSGVTATNALFTGTKTMYQSADGNFILGWTASGFDVFFGVKALAITGSNSISSGLYFTAALEDTPQVFGTDSYYGGTSNTGNSNGDGVVHQRVNVPFSLSSDYGSDNQINLNADGTAGPDFDGYQYLFGVGGQAFVAIGTQGFFSLVVGLHAPAFSGTGVYLNPIGVVNAASFLPPTASIAPGELLALFGTGLAPTKLITQGGQAFPTSLGGVSVTINGIPCPIFYVSSTQMSVIVPYAVASNQTGLANIQVNNNGTLSNVVQMYLTDASPGSFSQGSNGIGYASAVHASGQLITPANPAQPGETIEMFLTGLGTVAPAITDGAVAPSTPLSWSDLYNAGNLMVLFNDYGENGSLGNEGTIQYAGLAPTLAGLYQFNVQVPTDGLADGDDVYVEFITDAALMNQIVIPYGTSSAGASRPAARRLARARRLRRIQLTKPRPAIHRARRGGPVN
jgi:uncharacterized protein (TIGR03437 family)